MEEPIPPNSENNKDASEQDYNLSSDPGASDSGFH